MNTKGLILFESLPSLFIASRMQAKSTTAGTPVKSWGDEKRQNEDNILQLTNINISMYLDFRIENLPAREHGQAWKESQLV
jgi:hypothetical protein